MTTEEAVAVFEQDIKNCNPLFERKFIEAGTIAIQAIKKCEEYEKSELKEHDAKVKADAIEELLDHISESIIWDVLAEVMKRNIGASDGADKIIDYLREVAEQVKGAGK